MMAARDGGRSARALGELPAEVLERILALLGGARDLAAANAASRLFRGEPGGGRSVVERALRGRARARGHALPAALPARARTWTAELLARERALELARTHLSVAAAGGWASRPYEDDGAVAFSAFVGADGALRTCGEEAVPDEEEGGADGDDDGALTWRAPAASGHPPLGSVPVPARVASLCAVRVVAVAAGYYHLLALSEAGAVYGCGENERGQLGRAGTHARRSFVGPLCPSPPGREPFVCIAAGGCCSLALSAAGRAYSWGYNWCGQLGHGDTKDLWGPTRIEALEGVRIGGLAAGALHTLLLSVSGDVYSCGDNYHGQRGHGDQQERRTPRRIEALAGVRAVHVSAGYEHSLVVDAEGGAYSFGAGFGGELGHGYGVHRAVPTRIEALAGVRAVRACAGRHGSAVVCADGSVYTFGDNEYGQLGAPGSDGRLARLPARVQAFEPVRVLDCALSDTHALYVTADGSAHACGMRSAALGLGVSAADADDDDRVDAPARIGQLPRLGC